MARTYAYALLGALIATFTVTPVLASLLLPQHIEEAETIVVRILRTVYSPVLGWALAHRAITVAMGLAFLVGAGVLSTRLGSEFLPALEEGNYWIRAALPPTIGLAASGDHHGGVPARAAGQWQRRVAVLECGAVRATEAVRRVARWTDQGQAHRGVGARIPRRAAGHNIQPKNGSWRWMVG
jgi:hypothetical protein